MTLSPSVTDHTAGSPSPAATDLQHESALLEKIRWRLIPFMFLLYIVAYLDRVNVGFAALQMNRDLGFSAAVYGLGSGIFFIGYFLFEVPSNLIMEHVGARLWIARIMITWGMLSASMIFVSGPTSFYVMRFLLGLAEAGFFPGMILYLTYWFPKRELAQTVALFMTANALSGVVGGPLSGALLTMHGAAGLAGWRWMFLLEGLPAIALGFLVLAYLPNGPHEARWLDASEQEWLRSRLSDGRRGSHSGSSVRQVLMNRHVWHFSLMYFTLVIGLYSVSFWLPQILKSVSASGDFMIGILSAIPFIVAAVGMVWVGRHSDRVAERRWHVAIPALVGAAGLLLSAVSTGPTLAIAAISLAALGIWGALGPFWAMPAGLIKGSDAAASIACINSVGNLGGFVGPYAIGVIRDRTDGFSAGLATVAVSLVFTAILAIRSTLPPPTADGQTT